MRARAPTHTHMVELGCEVGCGACGTVLIELVSHVSERHGLHGLGIEGLETEGLETEGLGTEGLETEGLGTEGFRTNTNMGTHTPRENLAAMIVGGYQSGWACS